MYLIQYCGLALDQWEHIHPELDMEFDDVTEADRKMREFDREQALSLIDSTMYNGASCGLYRKDSGFPKMLSCVDHMFWV